jgi:hypothetical protein
LKKTVECEHSFISRIMIKKVSIICLLVILGATACDFPATQPVLPVGNGPLETAAIVQKSVETSPSSNATHTPDAVFTVDQTGNNYAEQNSSSVPCNRAAAGTPIDISIPDDTNLDPGVGFTKTWRLVNTGSCAWTTQYALVWFSGESLGVNRAVYLTNQVEPGQTTDISVEMLAPTRPGGYQSNWKIRDPEGNLFGIGPGGNSPIWVRITVTVLYTDTPVPLPSITATPNILSHGLLQFEPGVRIDLDSGKSDTGRLDDIILERAYFKGPMQLKPINNMRLGVFGMQQPSEDDCESSVLSPEGLSLDSLDPGMYLCYRTNQSLPGYLRLLQINTSTYVLNFEYTTWTIP